MTFEHFNQSYSWELTLDLIHLLFILLFILECILKLIAYSYHYFQDPWNIFDFVIILLSLLEIILDLSGIFSFIDFTAFRIIAIFRLAKLFTLIGGAKSITKPLLTLLLSIPALFNVGCILLVVVYIYAIVGINLFGNVKYGEGYNETANFSGFGSSMLLVFRYASLAFNESSQMTSCMRQQDFFLYYYKLDSC